MRNLNEENLTKDDMIVVADRTAAVVEGMWSYGMKLITKYYLSDLDGIVKNMDSDTYQDIKEMFSWGNQIKDLTITMAKQMDQVNLTNCIIVRQNNELLEKIGFLEEELESLKSKAKKND